MLFLMLYPLNFVYPTEMIVDHADNGNHDDHVVIIITNVHNYHRQHSGSEAIRR